MKETCQGHTGRFGAAGMPGRSRPYHASLPSRGDSKMFTVKAWTGRHTSPGVGSIFSVKGQVINTLGFVSHIQTLSCLFNLIITRKYPETVHE